VALILAFLGRYRLLIAGLLLALAAGLWWSAHERGLGAAHEKAAEAKRLAQAQRQVARREAKAASISASAASDLTAARVVIRTRTRTLIQKVPVYVPSAADARCVVNTGFVRLYDAAVEGSPPGLPAAAGGPDEAASGIALSEVLATDLANLGTAYDYRAEALAWRQWYAAQKKAWTP